ncbi:MAG: ABC transporter ATP-binding protein [Cytophagales bacterium]|nr:ABC transporter ATP-binding protein [Cytophagales bacterium]
MSEFAVKVERLSKYYQIGNTRSASLRDSISARIKSFTKGKSSEKGIFWALDDINFTLKKGVAMGIIGNNGAGKSTLLKILSRITEPSKGRFEMNGKVSSLLEVGTGFHPELTGRENVYLNGTILGMKRREVKNKFDEIVTFSGVEKFIDTPVKHYSSGMKVRLAFAVAAHLEPEILIIDEVLAVGDIEFQKKCLGKMNEVTGNGRSVLFVSHNMGAVSKLCDYGILLQDGKVKKQGDIQEVIRDYTNKATSSNLYLKESLENDKSHNIVRVYTTNSNQQSESYFKHDENIFLHIEFVASELVRDLNICISVYNDIGRAIFTSDRSLENYEIGIECINKAIVKIPANLLTNGDYSFLAAIHNPYSGAIEYLEYICPISVQDNGTPYLKYVGRWFHGDVFVDCHWDFS